MVPSGEITCPKCGEDRGTLISEINDPRGKRFYCCVCGHEFRESLRTPPEVPVNSK